MNKEECDNITSGYTRDIISEMDAVDPMPLQGCFHNVKEMYVSQSGHTRLFTATRYGKRYVLKCLKPDFVYTPVFRQALMKEFEIGLQLDHPYIRRTVGIEEVENVGTAIVQEYVDGVTLKELICRHTLTARLARKVAWQLAQALRYMHSKQILHRDVKPLNIMVTHNGENVRLVDFGLSDSDSFNVLKGPAGTSGYIAPELMNGDARTDIRADVYSYGRVLYDMGNATGDKKLLYIAGECTKENIIMRPRNMKEVLTMLKEKKKPFFYTNLLSIIVMLLAIFIAVLIYMQHKTPTERTVAGEKKSTAVLSDCNIVVDRNLWDMAEMPYSRVRNRL